MSNEQWAKAHYENDLKLDPQIAELAEQHGSVLEHTKNLDLMRAGYHVDAKQRIAALDAAIAALAASGKQQAGEAMDREQIGDLVEGMAVSVDVDGLFSTDGRRLFGTITAVQHEDGEKGGLMLLVQEPEPNWNPEQVGEVQEPFCYLFENDANYIERKRPGPVQCLLFKGYHPEKYVPLFRAPAQGIDLGQFRPAVLTAIGFTGPNDHERQHLLSLLALIDQRDAEQGVEKKS